jgi:asparagine synthase (glutamine-hydrolysing)
MDKRLEHAVSSRLVSDVPLGIFLSGGLDSSTIAYYAQKNSSRPIQTFSIGFEEKSFDESVHAKLVSDFLGTEHHDQMLTAKDALELIPRVADFLDEPVADYSIIPTYLLSRFTKQHVTVALGGDGGDELFFGYPTFQAERVFPLLKASAPVLKLLEKILPVSHAHFNARFMLHQLLQGLDVPEKYRHHAWMGTFVNDVFDDIDRYWEKVKTEPKWNKLIYVYLRTYLMDQVLVKVDRASMAASLEVRAPFLDYEFVDFVNSIPYTQKLHGLTTKYLLKELMKDKLPTKIVHRKKQGFGVPLGSWFAGELQSFVRETLAPEKIRAHGLFDSDMAQTLIEEHIHKKADHRKKLWSLVVFQMWYEKWCK